MASDSSSSSSLGDISSDTSEPLTAVRGRGRGRRARSRGSGRGRGVSEDTASTSTPAVRGRGQGKSRGRGRGRGVSEETTSTSTPAVRGRGRGKSRGRGRGRGVSEETTSTSTPAVRGRGRGKRKQPGAFHLSDEDRTRLEALKAARKIKAREMIKELKSEEKDEMLEEMVDEYPSLVLTIREKLMKRTRPGAPDPTPSPSTWPSWCICQKCREMPTDSSRVCCGMRPDQCHTLMPEMELSIIDEGVLTIQRIYRNDMFARDNAEEEDRNKAMRHAAYRQYILFIYGKLGRGVRKPVPSCVTWMIRDKYPDSFNYYVEYQPSW